jgi:AraC-like DNA-binding protein
MIAYREFAPPEGLSHTAQCLWMLVPDAVAESAGVARVLPDGSTDIVFSAGRLLVYGPSSSFHFVAVSEPVIGVRIRPAAARQALRISPSMLEPGPVPLDALWRRKTPAIEDRLINEPAPATRLAVFSRFLAAHMRPSAQLDSSVEIAVRQIDRYPSRTIRALTNEVGVSERQLRRRFRDHVGLGIKEYARIVRFDRLLDAARRRKRQFGAVSPNWAALGLDHGFADQAHLTREVGVFAGLTPTELFRML